jgi:hypothetical protein
VADRAGLMVSTPPVSLFTLWNTVCDYVSK